MKKLLIAFLLLICSTSLYPFFAIQRWVHPETGQIIEEYYDYHVSKPAVAKYQQADFIWACKQDGDAGLAIIEDADTNPNGYRRAMQFKTGPLGGLVALCQENNVPVINAECRWHDLGYDIEKAVSQQTLLYDDHPILNQFYASRSSYCWKLIEDIMKYPVAFLKIIQIDYHSGMLVDAQILHAIYTHKDKRIIRIAAGAGHIARINRFLAQLGWKIQGHYISDKLKQKIATDKNINDFVQNICDYKLPISQAYAGVLLSKLTEFNFPINIREIYSKNFAAKSKPVKGFSTRLVAAIKSKL